MKNKKLIKLLKSEDVAKNVFAKYKKEFEKSELRNKK